MDLRHDPARSDSIREPLHIPWRYGRTVMVGNGTFDLAWHGRLRFPPASRRGRRAGSRPSGHRSEIIDRECRGRSRAIMTAARWVDVGSGGGDARSGPLSRSRPRLASPTAAWPKQVPMADHVKAGPGTRTSAGGVQPSAIATLPDDGLAPSGVTLRRRTAGLPLLTRFPRGPIPLCDGCRPSGRPVRRAAPAIAACASREGPRRKTIGSVLSRARCGCLTGDGNWFAASQRRPPEGLGMATSVCAG